MKNSSLLRSLAIGICTFLPIIAYAAVTKDDAIDGMKNISGIIDAFTGSVVKSLATMFLSSAVVAFFYGVVEYVWGMREGDQTRITKGNAFLKWSLLGLFTMFSVYGIIKLGQNILFKDKDIKNITIPNINFKPGTSADVEIGRSTSGNAGQNSMNKSINSSVGSQGQNNIPSAGGGRGFVNPALVNPNPGNEVTSHSTATNRPSTWLPRPSFFSSEPQADSGSVSVPQYDTERRATEVVYDCPDGRVRDAFGECQSKPAESVDNYCMVGMGVGSCLDGFFCDGVNVGDTGVCKRQAGAGEPCNFGDDMSCSGTLSCLEESSVAGGGTCGDR